MGRVAVDPADAASAVEGLRSLADAPHFPLARDARSALGKISFGLSEELPSPAPVHMPTPIGPEAPVGKSLEVLSRALLRRKEVEFFYRGIRRQSAEDRHVQPWGLFMQHGHWYLVGHDLNREAKRVFRVDRMENVRANERTPNTPDFQIPDTFRIRDYQHREAWDLPGEETARTPVTVDFAFPRSLWADRNEFGDLVESRPDGSALRRLEVRDPDPLLRRLLSMEGQARVADPPELAAEFDRLVRSVLEVYGDA
jgi:proteasome accessory factor B